MMDLQLFIVIILIEMLKLIVKNSKYLAHVMVDLLHTENKKTMNQSFVGIR